MNFLKLGIGGCIGDGQNTRAHHHVLDCTDQLVQSPCFSTLYAFTAIFFNRAGAHPRLARSYNAPAQLPLRPNFVGRGGHNRVGIGLAVKFARNFRYLGEAIDISRFCRRRRSRWGGGRQRCRFRYVA